MVGYTQNFSSIGGLIRRVLSWSSVLLLAAIAAAPWWAERYTLLLLSEFCYVVALAQMWNLLAGYGGLLSIGQQAFVGVGGYTLAFFGLKLGINPFLTIPLAGLTCAILALPVGFLMFRLKGAFFAVGTWVVADVCGLVASNVQGLGGGDGVSIVATVIHMPAWRRQAFILWAALALSLGANLAVYLLLRSRYGLALMAVRDDAQSASSLGVSTRRVQWLVYLMSAVGCGMVGALLFITKLRISPNEGFSINWTIIMMFVVVIGGIGTIEGPIVGTLIYFVLREELSNYGAWYLISLGILTIVIVCWQPGGVWGSFHRRYGVEILPVRRYLSSRRFEHFEAPGRVNSAGES